jgi:hypothetical protein
VIGCGKYTPAYLEGQYTYLINSAVQNSVDFFENSYRTGSYRRTVEDHGNCLEDTLQFEVIININNELLRQFIQSAKNTELTTSILEDIEKGVGKSTADIAAIRKAQAEDLANVTAKVETRAEARVASKD